MSDAVAPIELDPALDALRARTTSGEAERDLAVLEQQEARGAAMGHALAGAVLRMPAGQRERIAEGLAAELGGLLPPDQGSLDVERAAIAVEQSIFILGAAEAVKSNAALLVRPGAVADLAVLDAAGELLGARAAKERRESSLATLSTLADALGAEHDPEKAHALWARARSLAANLGPAPLPPDCTSALEILRTEHVIPWLCEALQLTPGRPPIFVGYAGDGKSTAAISLAVCFATGWHAWSCERIKCSRTYLDGEGRVQTARQRTTYVDLDAGKAATEARVAEVLRAEGFDEELLEGAVFNVIDGKRRGLRLGCTGRMDVPTDADETAYAAAWRTLLAEYDLAIVDNLRKLGPRLNFDSDPRAAIVLDLLGEASTDTGSVPLVLAHSPKGVGRGPHQALKGKADLEGAAGGITTIWSDEDRRRHVQLTRGVALRWAPLVGYLDLTERGATLFTPDLEAAGKVAPSSGKSRTTPEQRDAARAAARDSAANLLIPEVVKAVFSRGKRGATAREVRDATSGTGTIIDRARAMAVQNGLIVARTVGAHDRFYGPSYAPRTP